MTHFGYTLMTEQSGPKDLVRWAIEIIRELRAGGPVTYRGQHCDVDSAEVWDLPLVQVGGEAQQRFLAEAANPCSNAYGLPRPDPGRNSCPSRDGPGCTGVLTNDGP